MAAPFLWLACFVVLGLALSEGLKALPSGFAAFLGIGRERAQLFQVHALLQEIRETLEGGLVPARERWALLRELPAPWGRLASSSLEELRSSGASVLPTIARLIALCEAHQAALSDAKARSAQALAQAAAGAALVPLFGGVLHLLLPGVQEKPMTWWIACALAEFLALAGAAWMLAIAEDARWAGLASLRRPWVLGAQCAGERFLALIRSGQAADLAWARACELLAQDAPGLASAWGASLWAPGRAIKPASPALDALSALGDSMRKALHVSLMEGRPCSERIEAALRALHSDLKALVERELQLVPVRALKPLFLCVAPALLGLLALGLYLSFAQAGFEAGG